MLLKPDIHKILDPIHNEGIRLVLVFNSLFLECSSTPKFHQTYTD